MTDHESIGGLADRLPAEVPTWLPEYGFTVTKWEDLPRHRCPHCGATSYNPNDAANRYCGRCNHFCDDVDQYPLLGKEMLVADHDYLSTGCFHKRHRYCQSPQGEDGNPKRPAECKFCGARCICPCHGAGLARMADMGSDQDE